MNVGIHLPQYGRVAGPDAIVAAAREAETLGFADVWVSDHVVHPAAQKYPSPYLYDPLLTLGCAAAVTERVGLGTSVLVVPMHEPVALANQLASLDALSKGRLRIAVGVGWSEPEYAALGADFVTRGRRLDEALEIFKVLWSDDPATFDGRFRAFADIRLLPKPVGRIPIWVGGGSEPAYRRAVRTGEGFQLIGVTPEEAAPVVARLRSERPEPEFTISLRTGWDPLGMDRNRIVEERAAYSEAGVQHIVAAPWRRDLAEWREAMEVLAGLVI
ncbi:MAG: TIGR03619 family F420-dependent LLM class oxidoreductase [Actinobacteria bacterium]|nr:MAG: TIGR03619 family F420-dependent LLM class oxidoreductase [Actinomycetota bacterium]